MGYAAEKMDGVTALRRPDKALRHCVSHTCNLSVYKPTNLAQATSSGTFPRSGSEAFEQSEAKEYVNFGAQRSDQVAADSDTAPASSSATEGISSRNQMTIAIAGCLSIGAVLGYSLSSLVNQPQLAPISLTQNSASSDLSARISDSDAGADPLLSVDTEALDSTDIAQDSEGRYLEEIDWLSSQNNNLKAEVEALSEESVHLNNELLQLELQVVALQQQSEPPTETRIVYNFVDVPIGGDLDSQTYSQNTVPIASSNRVSANPPLPNTASRQGLPLNQQQADEDNLASDDTYQHSDELYLESDEEYLDDSMLEDQSDQERWDEYNGGYPVDAELSYDPETGFYVNEQYINDETRYEIEEDDSVLYPPVLTE